MSQISYAHCALYKDIIYYVKCNVLHIISSVVTSLIPLCAQSPVMASLKTHYHLERRLLWYFVEIYVRIDSKSERLRVQENLQREEGHDEQGTRLVGYAMRRKGA